MTYDPEKHQRRSLRLKDYDYSQAGAYFVTICAERKGCIFGNVVDGEMQLNALGEVVREEWARSGDIRREIVIDQFVVMPNHLHGVVFIEDVEEWDCIGPRARATSRSPVQQGTEGTVHSQLPVQQGTEGTVHSQLPVQQGTEGTVHSRSALQRPSGPMSRSLSSFIAGLKAAVTKRVNELRGTPGVGVWQRNYYEHVIRDEDDLKLIREYVQNNPLKWDLDRENPNVRQNPVGAILPRKDRARPGGQYAL